MFEEPDGPVVAAPPKAAKVPCNLKLRSPNREQLKAVTIDVEQLVPLTHKGTLYSAEPEEANAVCAVPGAGSGLHGLRDEEPMLSQQ